MSQNNYSELEKRKVIFKKPLGSQRTVVIIVGIIFLAILVLGIKSFDYKIKSPFSIPEEDNQVSQQQTAQSDVNKDTDGDGLSDYDEIHVYHTSIYLEDTDSDGLSDKEEVDNGTNPLCPQGKDCLHVSAPDNSELIKNISSSKVNASNVDTSSLQKMMSGEVDANTLRDVLIKGGVSQQLVNSLSDDELLSIYKQSLENNSDVSNE